MAVEADKVIVELVAQMDKFNANVSHAQKNFQDAMTKIGDSANKAEKSALRSSTAISSAFAGIGLGVAIRQVQQMADAWTDFSSRVGLAIGDMELAPVVMDRIYEIAQRTYSALDLTAEAFISNSNTLTVLGKSTNEVLDYTEALNNALVVSGAKAEQAASIQYALSKAMASGKLSGDELNTVIEKGGRVAEVIAEELGVTTLQLRQMGKEGKITSEVLYNSLTKRMIELREQAELMPATIGDGFQKIRNALERFVGTADQATGISAVLASGLVYVADNFDSVAYAAAAVATVISVQYVPALARVALASAAMVATNPFLLLLASIGAATYALSAFGGEIYPIADEMANLHDYAGAAFDAVIDGASTAATVMSDSLLAALNLISEALGDSEVSWEDVWEVVKNVSNGMIGAMGLVYDAVVISFTQLPGAVAESVIKAMNSMINYIETSINSIIRGVNRAAEAINSLGSYVGAGDLIGTVGQINLSRLENEYAGAGKAAGEAFAAASLRANEDHLGKLGEAWRKAANERANERIKAEAEAEKVASGLSVGGAGGGSSGSGGSGGKGRKGKLNDLEREIQKIRERTEMLRVETAIQAQLNPMVDDYGYAMTKARSEQELLNAAQKAGIAITPELRQQISGLAEQYAQATVEAAKLAEEQDRARENAEKWIGVGRDVTKGLISDLMNGTSAADAFANALKKIGDALIDDVLNSIFQINGASGGGILSAIFGAFGGSKVKIPGFAQGTNSAPGGLAWVGEQGRELVNLPKGSQVIPNSRVNDVLSGTGVTLHFSPVIDNRGASAEAVARNEIQLENLKRDLPSIVTASVRKAQKSNMKLG